MLEMGPATVFGLELRTGTSPPKPIPDHAPKLCSSAHWLPTPDRQASLIVGKVAPIPDSPAKSESANGDRFFAHSAMAAEVVCHWRQYRKTRGRTMDTPSVCEMNLSHHGGTSEPEFASFRQTNEERSAI